MIFDPLLESVNVLSILATVALVILTAKPCRASAVGYLLAIPAGFGLMAIGFVFQALEPFFVSFSQLLAMPVEGIWLLTQGYGVLFWLSCMLAEQGSLSSANRRFLSY